MKKQISLIIFFCFLCLISNPLAAQQFELGKVTKNELREKFHPGDSAAPAAVLYEKAKTYFKYIGYWLVITEVETRIKIYKKEGYKYAGHSIYYRKGNSDFNTYSDAYTYTISGDSIVKTKLGPEGEFTEDRSKYTEWKKIILPDIKEGSVIEYKYITTRSRGGYLQDWSFQRNIPVNAIEYNVALPAYFTYHSIISGNLKISKTPQEVGMREGFQENRITYSASNIPALKVEPYIDNIDNYRPVIKHELAAITGFGGDETKYVTSWKTFVKNLYEDDNFGKQMEIQSYFRKDIDLLLLPGMTAEEKMKTIFNFVQNRMVWNGYAGFFCDEGVKEAYRLKTGNVADINLMLVAMLNYAGLFAEPVICSTRDNGIPVYPSTEVFNYVVCGVPSGNNFVLLDASGKYTTPGIIQLHALNKVGRRIKPNGSAVEVDLAPKKDTKSVYNVFATLAADGSISGKIRSQYFDYQALVIREGDLLKKQDEYISALEKSLSGIEITDYTFKNDFPKPLTEEYSFNHTGFADIVGGKILINPMLFFAQKANPFTADERLYPIDFIFSYQNKYLITLNLPVGYTVESFPESTSVVMGENVANFKYQIDVKNNQLQLSVVFEINKSVIEKENYNALKDFYRKALEKQNEKIILKKA